MLQRIISRGVAGPELTALAVARFVGVETGGVTRIHRGKKAANIIRRFGLASGDCSRRQALLHNIRAADGTLVFGKFGKPLETMLKREGTHYLCFPALAHPASVQSTVAWLKGFDIRTLNVVGVAGADAEWEQRVSALLLEVLQEMGRSPDRPQREATQVFVEGGKFYALALWPRQRAWRWDDRGERWRPFSRWQDLQCLRGRDGLKVEGRVAGLLPGCIRPWVNRPWGVEVNLLAALSRLGNPAADLARAGRWALLRLLGDAGSLLPRRRARWRALRRLLRGRQRDILGAFGFPASESAVQILAKVPQASATLAMLVRLRDLMQHHSMRVELRRLPQVNCAAVEILSDPWLRSVSAPNVLWQAASLCDDGFDDEHGVFDSATEFVWFRLEAHRTGIANRIGMVHSLRAMREILADMQAMPDVQWPAPPRALRGMPGKIEPLITALDLVQEGRVMHHCAGNYRHALAEGRSLYFRTLADPQLGIDRATLELQPGPDGKWHIAQLYGAFNLPVSTKTRTHIEAWRARAHSPTNAGGE